MYHFFLKLYLFLAAVFLLIACLIFYLTVHHDNLAEYVPEAAETYFHCDYDDFLQLKPDWEFAFIDYLAQNSALSYKDWRTVLETEPREIAVFSINGQFFLMTPETKKLNAATQAEQLAHTKTGKSVIFPQIRIESANSEQSWIEQSSPFFNFSEYLFLIRDLNRFSWPLDVQPNDKLVITGNVKGSRLALRVKTNNPLPFTPNIKNRGLNQLPNDTKVYFNNINQAFFSYQPENVPQNLKYLLFQSLNVKEYVERDGQFAFVFDKTHETANTIEKALSSTLAKMFPTETIKELPDKTEAIHLIAKPENWTFKTENGKRSIETADSGLKLEMIDTGDSIYLTNNMSKGDIMVLKNLTYEDSRISTCNIATQQNIIFVNPSQLGIKDINNLLITQKSATKFDICID